MRKIRTAFIGTGGIAQAHLRALQEQESIEVVALCDLIRERAEQTNERWNLNADIYTDYHELLARDDIESVNVCTYNQAHAQPSIDALQAGKNVLVEKPMAATLADATAMTAAAHAADKILMVAMPLRYAPSVLAAKAIFDAGHLGDIYYAETVMSRRKGNPGKTFIKKDTAGIGATADIGVYGLFTAMFLMGWPKPVAVSGIANNTLSKLSEQLLYTTWQRWQPEDVEVEDFGVAWVRFENGAVLVFKTSWLIHMDNLGDTFFLGTQAGLKMDPLTLFHQQDGLLMDSIVRELPERGHGNRFLDENLAFADAVREGKPSPIPADDMLLTNVIIQGLFDSAAQGGREIAVTVPTFS